MKNSLAKRKKRKKRIEFNSDFLRDLAMKILFNVLFIVITVYFLIQFFNTTGSAAVETERADLEIRQEIIELTGYIFRNEEVLYSPGGQSVHYLAEDGQKVSKAQIVAQLNNAAYDYSVKEQINALEKKLDIYKKSNINLEFVTTNIDKIDRDSNIFYSEMLKNLKKNRIKAAVRNRDEMLVLLNKKQIITKEAGGAIFTNLISAAEKQKAQLESRMISSGGVYADVLSNKSGIFYSGTDGYENYFTGDAVKTLDLDIFGELISKSPDNGVLSNAIGKVAYDYNWYLACKFEKTEKNKNTEFVIGRTYNIIYPYSSNKFIPSKLTNKIEKYNSNEILLVFETMTAPSDFDFSRKQTIQIVFNEIRGIRVPQEAMVVIDKKDLNAPEPAPSAEEKETDENGNNIIGGFGAFIEAIVAAETTDAAAVREKEKAAEAEPETETDENGNTIRRFISEDTVKGVYILRGNVVVFRRLPDSEHLATFDGYYIYADPNSRSDKGERGELQLNEDIIVAGKDLYNGKVVN